MEIMANIQEGPFAPTAPVELLGAQQIILWFYWEASSYECV